MQPTTAVTAVPRTFGILSIVFASLVLVSSLFGMLALIVPAALAHAPPSSRPEEMQALKLMSTMYLGMGIVSCILAVMSGLLLALGIGQLRYRQWAAVWSVRWGVVALGTIVIMAIVLTTTMGSMVGSFASAANAPDPSAARHVGTAFGAIYGVMMVLFYAPYPILLIVYFARDRVRAAMTA
jgi:hypothetical protein